MQISDLAPRSSAVDRPSRTTLTAGDVAQPAPEVCGSTPVPRVDAMFQNDGALRAVVVRDEERCLVLTRARLEFALAGRFGFGRSIYGRRQVRAVVRQDDLVLPAQTPLPLAAQLLMAREPAVRYDDALVAWSDGRAAVLTVSDVFRTLADGYLGLARQVTDSLHSVARGVGRLTRESQEVASAAASATCDAELGLWAAENSSITIDALGVWRDEIDDVVRVISKVAQTTNLLALNARIEASRAGDLGHGFAAVAGEVKTLAVQSSTATGQVAVHSSSMQAALSDATSSVSEVLSMIRRMTTSLAAIQAAVATQAHTTTDIGHQLADALAGVGDIAVDAAVTLA